MADQAATDGIADRPNNSHTIYSSGRASGEPRTIATMNVAVIT